MKHLTDDLRTFVFTMCEDVATPRGVTVAILVRYGEYDQLVNLQTDASHYLDWEKFKKDLAVTSFLKKLPDLPTTIDRKAVAVENFFKSEGECLATNLRLAPFLDGALAHPDDEAVFLFFQKCREEARRILGPCPLHLRGRFGPGSTFSDRGKLNTVPDKMSSRPTFTPSASSFLLDWKETAWARACAEDGNPPRCIPGNRFTTVPKDATKDRGIAVEPSVNVFFQLGYGQVIRERLRREGLDLLSAQGVHRQVARESSKTGLMATVDLSNASDTMCINLVKLILPSSWFECLSALRSRTTLIEGKQFHLEKFSSMGNGFTFELETLIFYILARVACSNSRKVSAGVDIHVYGDDIIVPTECISDVLCALRYSGFTPNPRKTFFTGVFRESCGGDYFMGQDVRPYFQKKTPNEPQDYIAMANGIRRMAHSNSGPSAFPRVLTRTWHRILDAIPSDIRRLRGPEGLGDIVIHDDQVYWERNTRWQHSIRYVKCYQPVRFRRISWAHFRPHVVLASALYGVGDGARGITPRDAVLGYAPRWVPFS